MDIVTVYCSLIRSVLEYACPVWHSGLTIAQSKDIERVQKRCLRITFPELCYSEALVAAKIERLDKRREDIVKEMFQHIQKPSHILHSVLDNYRRKSFIASTRTTYPFLLPAAKTQRYLKSFFPFSIKKNF